MTVDYYWIFPESRFSSIKMFPDEFLVPSTELKVDPGKLIGARLFLIADSGSNLTYLSGIAIIQAVAEVTEGVNTGDYELFTDRLRSFRTINPNSTNKKGWEVSLSNQERGIHIASNEFSEASLQTIEGHETYTLVEPGKSLTAIPEHVNNSIAYSSNEFQAAISAYAFILKVCPIGQYDRYQKRRNLSPFGSIAISLVRSLVGKEWAECEAAIVGYDLGLQSSLQVKSQSSELIASTKVLPPYVDVLLSELDVDLIRSRRFVRKSKTIDLQGWLEKTQEAEKAHQEILRQLTEYLKLLGYSPLFSRSVDLAIMGSAGLLLFEVKSANKRNFIKQGERSLIQLIRYALAFEEHGINALGCLCIISSPREIRWEEYLTRFLEKVGCVPLFHHAGEEENEQKFPGLKELLESMPLD